MPSNAATGKVSSISFGGTSTASPPAVCIARSACSAVSGGAESFRVRSISSSAGQVMSMPMPSVRKSCFRQRQSSSMPGTMRTPSCAPRQIHSGTPLTARRSVKATSVSRSSQQRSASARGESSPPAVRLLWICRSVCAMERPPTRFRIREGFRKDRSRPPG